MTFEFRLPDIGEGVTEGEIVEWYVNQGDAVGEDDPMVEVMTDKATVPIGAPRAGTIADIRFGVGEVAQVGEVIVVIATEDGGTVTIKSEVKEAKADDTEDKGPAATAVGDIRESLPGTGFLKKGAAKAAKVVKAATQSQGYFKEKPLATPATRKLARDLGLDLRTIPPTGKRGRVSKDDVQSFASAGGQSATLPAAGATKAAPQSVAARQVTSIDGRGLEERKPFVGIRRKIAERMQHTKNTAAHFTFVEECNVSDLMELRKELKTDAAEAGAQLTFLPFIVKAVVAALKKHPVLNSALDESTNELVYRNYYDVGIAASTDAGLMVPVLKSADRLSILDIAKEVRRLGDGAREGSLQKDELTGSTFTITSLGKQGGLFATPILNHPEVGILGVHQIKERPVVKDGEIAIGHVMLLSLSFDHRIVDGHVGAAFAYDIINLLENPKRLLLIS